MVQKLSRSSSAVLRKKSIQRYAIFFFCGPQLLATDHIIVQLTIQLA